MRTRWWLLVAAYVAVLFAMQPRLGFVVDAAKERWGVPAFEWTMLAAAVAAGLLFVALAMRIWRTASRADRMLLVAVAALYVVGVSLLDIPQERLHYVEYGLLAGLVYFACRRDLKRNMSVWIAGSAVGTAVLRLARRAPQRAGGSSRHAGERSGNRGRETHQTFTTAC